MIETRAAFARRLNVNRSIITRGAQAGRLVLTESGLVEVEASLKRWNETKGGRCDVAARHAQNRAQVIPKGGATQKNAPAPACDVPEGGGAEILTGDHSRTLYKADALGYENRSIKLEMALRRHLRYPLAGVRKEAQAIGSTLRAAIERTIDQLAARLALLPDELSRRRLLQHEARKLRWLLRAEFPRALRRLRQGGEHD